MRSTHSIDCACGGFYVKSNKYRHFKTKTHQNYERDQEPPLLCSNGCNRFIDGADRIFTVSKDEEEEIWCHQCITDYGREVQEDGWFVQILF